jgi:hypothetical protein
MRSDRTRHQQKAIDDVLLIATQSVRWLPVRDVTSAARERVKHDKCILPARPKSDRAIGQEEACFDTIVAPDI